MPFDPARDFRPGDRCEASGIYLVNHGGNHVPPHEVTVVFGDAFPYCRECGEDLRFRAVRLALHASNDTYLTTVSRQRNAF